MQGCLPYTPSEDLSLLRALGVVEVVDRVVEVRIDCAIDGNSAACFAAIVIELIDRGALVGGLIADIRRATIALDLDAASPPRLPSPTALDRASPVALVVSGAHEPMFLRWQWAMAHEGLVRGVFLEMQHARDWVRSCRMREFKHGRP